MQAPATTEATAEEMAAEKVLEVEVEAEKEMAAERAAEAPAAPPAAADQAEDEFRVDQEGLDKATQAEGEVMASGVVVGSTSASSAMCWTTIRSGCMTTE